jgi:hypothetical protein
MSVSYITISMYCIPNRYPISQIDIHIDIPLMSDLPYRHPMLIFNIDFGLYIVTLPAGAPDLLRIDLIANEFVVTKETMEDVKPRKPWLIGKSAGA